MNLAIVTTVTRSYVPLARILMASVAQHHPDARRVVLQLDGPKEHIAGAEVITPASLISDKRELSILEAIYSPIEYATALKPKLMLRTLETADQVIFLDPDMRVFQPMTAAIKGLQDGHGTLLTPHRLTPPEDENRDLYEWAFKAYGMFNTAFVGTTNDARTFLEWWDKRLLRDCLTDLKGMHWVDQRIVDLAPGYFEIDQLRDPGYNVCWWNLEERPLRREGTVWMAGDTPLVVMHYSGVRPGKAKGDLPYLFHSTRNLAAYRPDQLAAVGELEDEYIADLMASGYRELSNVEYGYRRTPAGRELTAGDRRRYRRRVLAAEAAGATPPLPDDVLGGVRTTIDHGVDAACDSLKRLKHRL